MATEEIIVQDSSDVFDVNTCIAKLQMASGKPIKVTMKPVRDSYSDLQLAYFWKLCRLIGDYSGESDEYYHDMFCYEFLGTYEIERFGEHFKELRTITKPERLDVQEMSILIEKMLNWISVNLPDFIVPKPPKRKS